MLAAFRFRSRSRVPSAPFEAAALLDSVPVPNTAVRSERRGEALVLWVPIKKKWWMGPPLGWLLPFRQEKGIALDELGQEVWRACDGERTLEAIVEQFAERHRLRFHEARQCVLQFLRSLTERSLMAVAVPQEQAEERPA